MDNLSGSKNELILIVTDINTISKSISALLNHEGYNVVLTTTMEQTLKMLKTHPPDLVLLSSLLSSSDWLKTCYKIKAETKGLVPIILLVPENNEKIKELGIKNGCTDFLELPISKIDLITRVKNVLQISRLTRQLKLRSQSTKRVFESKNIHAHKAQNKYSILIVEDKSFNLLLLKAYLKSDNYDITTTSSGKKALELLKEKKFDLILLDIYLPDINGLEILKEIKNNSRTKFIPVILITASEDTETKIRGIEAGANDYLIKPINRLELKARVKSLLSFHLTTSYAKVAEKAVKDGMTGLYNNSYLKEYLKEEIDYCNKIGKPLSLLMMDLDDFKDYNDTNGHLLGDKALQEVSSIILNNIRSTDLPARYGGEEFALVLPDTTLGEAKKVAQRIRRQIETHIFEHQDKMKRRNLPISIGVAQFKKGMDAVSFLQEADSALYQAKRSGKNIIVYK